MVDSVRQNPADQSRRKRPGDWRSRSEGGRSRPARGRNKHGAMNITAILQNRALRRWPATHPAGRSGHRSAEFRSGHIKIVGRANQSADRAAKEIRQDVSAGGQARAAGAGWPVERRGTSDRRSASGWRRLDLGGLSLGAQDGGGKSGRSGKLGVRPGREAPMRSQAAPVLLPTVCRRANRALAARAASVPGN